MYIYHSYYRYRLSIEHTAQFSIDMYTDIYMERYIYICIGLGIYIDDIHIYVHNIGLLHKI